jgi:Glycosyl hydrolase family 99
VDDGTIAREGMRGRSPRERRRRLLVSGFVGALAAFAAGVEPAAAATRTFTFPAAADAYVSSSQPTVNFGTSPSLVVRGSPEHRTYQRFNVTGLGLPPSRAYLQVTPARSSSSSFRVRPVASTTWSESTITYADAPPYTVSSEPPSSGSLVAGRTTRINVTRFVPANGAVSLALTGSSSAELLLHSREAGAVGPKLVVETPGVAPDGSLAWPIPGAFYYPWFPEGWSQLGYTCGSPPPPGLPATPSGCFTRYQPSAGFYSLDTSSQMYAHIRAFDRARLEVAISSWWGQGSATDNRFGNLLSRTRTLGSRLKWAIYHEQEGYHNLSVDQIRADLAHIQSRYTSHPSYARVAGRPVIFVYNANDFSCEVGERWKQANVGYDFHIVLKVFGGYRSCGLGLDWHQYGPDHAVDVQSGFSFVISPGYWRADEPAPRLARDPARWAQDIQRMKAANVHWQLVTSFNEWGEGTSVESATDWPSPSGYGVYLDALASR